MMDNNRIQLKKFKPKLVVKCKECGLKSEVVINTTTIDCIRCGKKNVQAEVICQDVIQRMIPWAIIKSQKTNSLTVWSFEKEKKDLTIVMNTLKKARLGFSDNYKEKTGSVENNFVQCKKCYYCMNCVTCSKCGMAFPSGRKTCPKCRSSIGNASSTYIKKLENDRCPFCKSTYVKHVTYKKNLETCPKCGGKERNGLSDLKTYEFTLTKLPMLEVDCDE